MEQGRETSTLQITKPSVDLSGYSLSIAPVHLEGHLQEELSPHIKSLLAMIKNCAPEIELTGLAGDVHPDRLTPSPWIWLPQNYQNVLGSKELEDQMIKFERNIQPIIARRCAPSAIHPDFPQAQFEVLSGLESMMIASRHDLKAPVLFVEADDEDAARLLVHSRALSAYEFGYLCKKLKNDKIFRTQKEIAHVLGKQESDVTNAMKLVNLDPAIIDAFAAPTVLQYKDAAELEKTWAQDEIAMRGRAIEATKKRASWTRLQTMALLLGTRDAQAIEAGQTGSEVHVMYEGTSLFVISTTVQGKTSIQIKAKHLAPQGVDALKAALEQLLNSSAGVYFQPT